MTDQPTTYGDPMPVFVLKGKDALTPYVIEAYRERCVDEELYDQAHEVALALAEVEAWQRRHPELVKLPDHKHVPADAEVR